MGDNRREGEAVIKAAAKKILIYMGKKGGRTVSYSVLYSRMDATQENIRLACDSLQANGYTLDFMGAGSTGSERGQRMTQKGRIAAKRLRGML